MNYYDEIKNQLLINEVNKRIKNYSKRLTKELGKGYTYSSLTRMKKFYLLIEKLATMSQHLTYGHYIELLPFKDINKIKYYIKIIEDNYISIRELRKRIKSLEYERVLRTTYLLEK